MSRTRSEENPQRGIREDKDPIQEIIKNTIVHLQNINENTDQTEGATDETNQDDKGYRFGYIVEELDSIHNLNDDLKHRKQTLKAQLSEKQTKEDL